MIKVRVDDFPMAQPTEHYTPENLKLLYALEKLQIPYYLGVTPDLVSYYDLGVLKKLKYARIAMHGFNHGFDKWRPISEFDGMSDQSIYDNVVRCSYFLSKIQNNTLDTFVPPFNLFNQILLNALNVAGFSYITGGPETNKEPWGLMDYTKLDFGNIKLIMSLGSHYTSNGSLREILKLMHTIQENEIITLHLTGDYDLSGC